jgi:hypothetical protein
MYHYEFSRPDPNAPRMRGNAIGRIQPVCIGTGANGELLWKKTAMALWQQAMFPIKYAGDFINFWWKTTMREVNDEQIENMPSMILRSYDNLKKPRKHHRGD